MAGKRQHVVPRFHLQRFGRETDRGPRVCRLEIRSGANRQISPRDAEVAKNFYTVDVEGAPSLLAEEALQVIETTAAPIIEDVVANGTPVTELRRVEVATFLAAARTRTPIARHITKTAAERAELWRLTDHELDNVVRRASEAAEPGVDLEQLRQQRDRLAEDLRSGAVSVEAPCELLVALAMSTMIYGSFVFSLLDWVLVRSEGDELTLPDAVISCRDPSPMNPETGAFPLSSLTAETFVPLDPRVGLLLRPTTAVFELLKTHDDVLRDGTPREVIPLIAAHEGGWSEQALNVRDVRDLNLLSYSHAHRAIYGSQRAVTESHRDARRRQVELAALRPRPAQLHILEEHPTNPDLLIETETIMGVDPRAGTTRPRAHNRGRGGG